MYDEMLGFVKGFLKENDTATKGSVVFPFRSRFGHTERVFMWAKRLLEGAENVDSAAVLTACVFHDAGYGFPLEGTTHAENSALVCEKYLTEHRYEPEFIAFVTRLVRSHSNKALLSVSGTPPELIVLMEADLLDETGALSIVWDCMMEGGEATQSFEKTLRHIQKYSGKLLERNPMVTPKAREYWAQKQALTQAFIIQLEYDLGLSGYCTQPERR